MASDPKLVVALEARLDKFERQMKEAGVIADRGVKEIEDKFSRANPSFSGGFLGGLAGALLGTVAFDRLIAKLQEVNSFIVEMGDVSKRTGIDLERLQELRFAIGSQSSLSGSDFLKGVDELGKKLNDARRDENDLTKLFEANNVVWKDRNGTVISTNEALKVAARLVQNAATEFDKIKIAEIFRLTKDWVQALENGPEGIEATAAKFRELGLTIDRETIKKAQEFQDEWNRVSTIVSVNVQAGLVEMARLIEELVIRAGPLVKIFEAVDAVIKRAVSDFNTLTGAKGIDLLGEPRGDSKTKLTVTPAPRTGPATVIPGKEAGAEGKDAFERQVDTINKHIAAMEADAEAVGKTAGEHAELRVEAQLTEALLRAGIDINDKYADSMEKIAAEAKKAADTLESRKLAFTEFLSGAKDLSSGLSEAFKGMVLEGKKFDEVLKNLLNRLASRSIDKLFEFLLLGPGGKGTSGLLGSLFGGARAEGGPVSAGKTYLVGERGRELFVPKVPGTIVPHDVTRRGMSGSSIQNVFNVAGEVSQASVDRLERMVMRTNRVVTQQGRGMASAQHMQRTGVSLA